MNEKPNLADLERSASELQEELFTLAEEIASIKDQLAEAKTRRLTEGEYSDPDWWRRANSALRHKGREHQEVQRELADLTRTIKQVRHDQQNKDDERRFVEAARLILAPEQYRQIWAEVQRLKD